MSCPLHALTHVHARTHTHTHVNSDVPGDSKSIERGLHPLCNKRWTWARPDWPGGEPCSRLSRAQHEPARPGATERPGRDVCRTTPIPLQEPCRSCQAGLTVPAPVLCWHAPAPNPTQPPPPSGVSHAGMPLPQPCSLGPLPSTDAPCAGPPAPRDLGPVVSTPGAWHVRPLLCPEGLWADGRPAGLWPAPASSEGPSAPASPQMPPPTFAFLAGLPGIRCPALHTPGGSGWAAQGGQALGLPPQELPASISWSAHCFCLGQLWVLSSFLHTHVPGTASLDTLRPFQPGLRLSRPLPLCTRARLSAHRAGVIRPCSPLRGRPGLSRAGSAPSGRLSPRKVGAAMSASVRQGGDQTATRRRPGARAERRNSGRQAGHQTRHLQAASSCFPLKLLSLQKPLGSPHVPGKRIYYLFKNGFPVLTRGR